jgi:hypothetical protein
MTIDVDEREVSLEVNSAQIVLDIILVGSIDLNEVDGHVLSVQASLPELIVAIGPSNITYRQRLGVGAAIERRIVGYM